MSNLRFLLISVGIVVSQIAEITADNDVLLTNLEPGEAKQIIDQQDQSLRYAPKIETNVPAVRYLGNEPHSVLEDIYLARQYHGQDGLGAYLYGYSVPDIAKNEKKERSGDLKGAYSYVNTEGKEIRVKYWDDGTGFHQVDNLDQVLPKQVEDSPDVKAAKERFFRIWNQEAQRNAQGNQQPQPIGPFGAPQYPYQGQPSQPSQYPYQGQPSQPSQYPYQGQPSQPSYRVQQPTYTPPGGFSQTNKFPSNPNSIDYSGQYSDYKPSYAQPATKQQNFNPEETEENGPPKGFFYAFDYPVGIIVNRGEKVKREDLQSIYSQGKNLFERQLRGEAPAPRSDSSLYVAATRK